MGFWSSITGGASELKSGIIRGVHWVWDNAIISRTAKGGVKLVGQMLSQVAAIPAAIPKAMSLFRENKDVELVKNNLRNLNLPHVSSLDVRVFSERIKEEMPEIAYDAGTYVQWALSILHKQETIDKIRSGIGYLVQHEILPLIGIYALKDRIQTDFFPGDGHEATTAQFYLLWAYALVNLGYSLIQTQKIVTDVSLLNSVGISAIKANANKPPSALCTAANCSEVNKFMDSQKEMLLLFNNTLLLSLFKKVPYLGSPLALAGGILSTGRYLNRVGNTGCEAHKGIQLGSALALGGVYKLTEWPFRSVENHLPWGAYFALTTLLLLAHVNIVANMELPVAEPDDLFTRLDPINVYEKMTGLMIDVTAIGLAKKLELEPNTSSYFSLSTILKRMTNILENDYLASRKQFFSSSVLKQLFKNLFLARMFHSTDDFVHDKFIVLFWSELRAGVIGGINNLEEWHKTLKLLLKPVERFSTPIAAEVRRQFDVPKPMTKILIKLANRKDVMQFLKTLRTWLEQHNTKIDLALSAGARIPLRGATAAFPQQRMVPPIPLLNEGEDEDASPADAAERLDRYIAASVAPLEENLELMDNFLAQPVIVIPTRGSAAIDASSKEVPGLRIESPDGAEFITPAAAKNPATPVTPHEATAAVPTTSAVVDRSPISDLEAYLVDGTQAVDPGIDDFLAANENVADGAGISPDSFFNTTRQRRSPSLQEGMENVNHKYG